MALPLALLAALLLVALRASREARVTRAVRAEAPSQGLALTSSAGRSDHLLVALRTTLSGGTSLSSRYDRSPRSSLLSMYGLESPKSHT